MRRQVGDGTVPVGLHAAFRKTCNRLPMRIEKLDFADQATGTDARRFIRRTDAQPIASAGLDVELAPPGHVSRRLALTVRSGVHATLPPATWTSPRPRNSMKNALEIS